uniref:response regulator transcription factor n=1 Tax=Allofournierella sp. TaxID=1940256 RepID=UPI003AB762A0
DGAELVLLDVNLPDTDGFALAGQIRQKSGAPLIFITAHDLDEEMVRAFELGADDYITKPFNLQVALGRIGAVLRRAGAGAEAGVLRIGALEVDPARGRAGFAGMPLELTPTEYRLLLALAENRGRVVTRQQLLERLWDSDADFVDEHTLTLNVSRLRAKLGAEYIHTVRGLGYRLAEEGGA